MRKFFFWFGILAAGMALLIICLIGYAAYTGTKLDQESAPIANADAVAITSHWSVDELMKRASPSLKQSANAQQISSIFDWFSTLGPLTKSENCNGSSFVKKFIGKPASITAHYICNEQYQQGPATVDIVLIKLDNMWMINSFHVNSPALVPHKTTKL